MTSHAFYNNVAPFPSRQRPTELGQALGGPSHPFPQPPLRSLPTFGSPNEFPNPSAHYFPSKPGAYNRRARSSSAEEDAAAEEERRPPGPFPGAGGGKMRRGDRTTWDAGSELMRAEQDHDEHPGEDMEMEDGDAVSTRSKDAESVKGDAASASGKEVKKRSRTLTTAHQTAVLNALLAKTRFPSTETREEVGQQIGMSARRVQIWFQNRRQSQKRARDREASEMAMSPSHHYDYQQRADPYARYPPAPPSHSSATSTTSTVRPDLSRQTSRESVASRSSFTSARTSHSAFSRNAAPQDTLSPLSDVTPRWPGGQAFGTGWPQQMPPQQVTSPGPGEAGNRGSMFFPSPARADDPSRPRTSSTSAESGATFKLPSLSSVLGNSLPAGSDAGGFSSAPQPGPRQVVFTHSQPFAASSSSASRPPPAPSSGTRGFTNPAPPSTRPFDDFSRLRISSEGPLSPGPLSPPPTGRGVSPPDVLDAAMETVYRQPNVNPPRSSLPPLRMNSSGRYGSEADAALLAPILPPIALSASHPNAASASKTTLPPLSSLALSTPAQPFPSRPSTWSQQSTSSAGPNHTRSSVSSFETLGTTSASSSLPGSSLWGPTSFTSSRTSFSSEVQEEWDRMSQAGVVAGRKVKTEAVGAGSGWETERRTVGLTSDVRMES